MPDSTTWTCAECGATFDSQARYAAHARHSTHDVNGPARPHEPGDVTPSLLSRAFGKLRFGRDTDGDGKLDISRRDLYRQLGTLAMGTIVGHTLAHDPASAQQVISVAFGILFGGRAVSRLSWLPVQREWFDSKALDRFGFGLLFGVALVFGPWSSLMDAAMHLAGEGHAPGAH